MPGNIWLILIAAIAVGGNGLRLCGNEVQAKCASTYMIAVSVRLKFKCGYSDLRGYLIDACKAVA